MEKEWQMHLEYDKINLAIELRIQVEHVWIQKYVKMKLSEKTIEVTKRTHVLNNCIRRNACWIGNYVRGNNLCVTMWK